MPKIAFIGAGSFEFTRSLVRDIFTYPGLREATIALMDVNEERLGYSKQACERIVREGKYPGRVEATLDRATALKGADAVVTTILAHDVSVWRHDIEIPKKFGVDINVGDTRGPAGVFRALRTIPVMLDIIKDVERYCPEAIVLNYTNPMAMLCRAMQRAYPHLTIVGLCHSVQGTAEMLAWWINKPMSEITYLCAGINHQAWYLEFKWKRKDAYPLLREALRSRKIYQQEIVRNEMFLHLGYYVTESSGHNSEYNAWFRKRPDLIKKYCLPGTGWNPGEHAFILKEYLRRKHTWRKTIEDWLTDPKPLKLERGNEYAAGIINAYLGGEPVRFNGNVPNKGLITNLPSDACVEVPVFADRRGLNPVHVGALPPQLAALNQQNVAVEEMAVEASFSGDPRLVFYAICFDPLTSAVLSLAEIKKMVGKMLKVNAPHLPQFKRVDI
ncbi:MAG: alpha-galactosidase [bacterium]|nr:alpha-galactosidase [bacterium]